MATQAADTAVAMIIPRPVCDIAKTSDLRASSSLAAARDLVTRVQPWAEWKTLPDPPRPSETHTNAAIEESPDHIVMNALVRHRLQEVNDGLRRIVVQCVVDSGIEFDIAPCRLQDNPC